MSHLKKYKLINFIHFDFQFNSNHKGKSKITIIDRIFLILEIDSNLKQFLNVIEVKSYLTQKKHSKPLILIF
jgi:hypothetical protein